MKKNIIRGTQALIFATSPTYDMKKLILLHTDVIKDSLLSDNSFIILLIGLGVSIAFLLHKFLKK